MSKFLSGLTFVVISFFMAIGYVKANIQSSLLVEVSTFSLMVGAPLMIGLGLIYSDRHDRRLIEDKRDRIIAYTLKPQILDLAQRSGGKLILSEVVAGLKVKSRPAQLALDSLMTDQLAELKVMESGTLMYVFPDLQG